MSNADTTEESRRASNNDEMDVGGTKWMCVSNGVRRLIGKV